MLTEIFEGACKKTNMTIQSFILIVHSLFSLNMGQSSNNQDTTKVTVLGRAIVIKHHAAVRTDDSLLYYLDGIYDWDIKFKGKRVKVTGQLVPIVPQVLKIPGSDMTLQPRLRDGRYLKKAKWKLVK